MVFRNNAITYAKHSHVFSNLSQVIALSGREAGLYNLSQARQDAGQFGRFDYQRQQGASGWIFLPAYTDASNFGVGFYMHGAGSSLPQTLLIGELFALLKSTTPDMEHLRQMWAYEYHAAIHNQFRFDCDAQANAK